MYAFGVEDPVSSFRILVDVGFVVKGVVRSLKFESCAGLLGGTMRVCCGYSRREEERFEMSLRGLETWRGIDAGGLGNA